MNVLTGNCAQSSRGGILVANLLIFLNDGDASTFFHVAIESHLVFSMVVLRCTEGCSVIAWKKQKSPYHFQIKASSLKWTLCSKFLEA